MPRPRNITEMRPSTPARNFWPFLNGGIFHTAFRRLAAPTLRNADRLNVVSLARLYISLAVEAAISRVEFRRRIEGTMVVLQRRHHVNFIRGISLDHLILSNQADGAFGKEHLVTELKGLTYLTSLDRSVWVSKIEKIFFVAARLLAALWFDYQNRGV